MTFKHLYAVFASGNPLLPRQQAIVWHNAHLLKIKQLGTFQ